MTAEDKKGGGTAGMPLDQRLARMAVRPLARTPVTPNMVTGLGLFVGLAAGLLLAQGGISANWGAGVFMIAVWLDHADGELARMTGKTSIFGHYFDHAAAMTSYVAMFVGAGVGLRGGELGPWAIVLGIAAGLAVAAIMSVRMWVEIRAGREATAMRTRGGFQIEDVLYVVGPVTWFGALQPFVLAAGIGAPAFLLWVIWQAFREARLRVPR